MSEISDVERADQLGRQRARVLPALLLIFFGGQFAFWSEPDATRLVDQVRLAAWAAYVIVFLLFLGHGGGFILSKGVRRLLNDESFRANRVRAQAAGFWGIGPDRLRPLFRDHDRPDDGPRSNPSDRFHRHRSGDPDAGVGLQHRAHRDA